ncbi:MAG: ABC transporter permease [Chlamydiae bacterium]|nr:ABC transporter permease [Chlamydiota bacterium]
MNKANHISPRRIRALIIKEFFQIIRDPISLALATIFPLFLLFMYGYGISLDVNKLNVGLVLQDKSESIDSFVSCLENSNYFSFKTSSEPKTFYKPLTNSEIDAIIWIPPYFSQYFDKSLSSKYDNSAPIFVVTDGSSPNTASFAQNYISGLWQNWLEQFSLNTAIAQPTKITVSSRFWFNEDMDSHFFLVPGSIAIIMTLIGTLLTALMIAREWERGTMEALMATPVTMKEILLSKLIPYFFLGMFSMTICTIFGHYLFDVPFRGSFFALCLITFFFLLVALATGLLISSVSKDQFTASQISIISAFLPAFMLSGFIFEISSMPLPIRILTQLLPARYFVSSLQTLFLTGDVWPLIWKSSGILSLFAIFFFVLIGFTSKKGLE